MGGKYPDFISSASPEFFASAGVSSKNLPPAKVRSKASRSKGIQTGMGRGTHANQLRRPRKPVSARLASVEEHRPWSARRRPGKPSTQSAVLNRKGKLTGTKNSRLCSKQTGWSMPSK